MIRYSGKGNVISLSDYVLEQAYIALQQESINKEEEDNYGKCECSYGGQEISRDQNQKSK